MTQPQSGQPALHTGWLVEIPRISLGFLPTPLVPLDRLSEQLGGPRLWLKRDDCTGLATGGNKTRKLEYLLADARSQGADVVVSFGAVQSNHARQTAAACAAVGLPCHLVLTRRVRWKHPGYETSGNVLLDRLLGATIDIVEPETAGTHARELLERLRTAGRRPYVIPTGGSNPVGALGYARCAMELLEQSQTLGFRLTDVLHASSSAGTQAGLLAGFAGLLPARLPRPAVHGVNVYTHDAAKLEAAILAMAASALQQNLAADATTLTPTIAGDAVRLDSRYLGEDYGLPTAATIEAVRLLARREGVLLDPVYSGKAFGGLIDRVRRGEFAGCENLVFIHTGGTATLAVYDEAFG